MALRRVAALAGAGATAHVAVAAQLLGRRLVALDCRLAAVWAAFLAAGAGGATGAAAFGRAGAALKRFCASAYFASRMARRLSILLIVHSRDEPTRSHRQRRSPAPVDRVVDVLQPAAAHRVVLRDPRDPTAQVLLEGGHVVAVLRARSVAAAVVQDRPQPVVSSWRATFGRSLTTSPPRVWRPARGITRSCGCEPEALVGDDRLDRVDQARRPAPQPRSPEKARSSAYRV